MLGESRRCSQEPPGEEKKTDHVSSRLWQTPPPPNAEKQKRESTCPATLLSYGGNYMRVCSGGRRRSIGWSQRLVSGALFRGQTEIPRDYGKRRAASVWWRVFCGPLTRCHYGRSPALNFWVDLKNLGLSAWPTPHPLTTKCSLAPAFSCPVHVVTKAHRIRQSAGPDDPPPPPTPPSDCETAKMNAGSVQTRKRTFLNQ